MVERSGGLWLPLVLVLACGAEAGPPPYGFDVTPEQCFRLEGEDPTVVDGTPVQIQRFAQFRLVVDAASQGRYELALLLERYYLRVEGAPGGTSEFALSSAGLLARGGPQGEMRLGPEEIGPGGASIRTLLSKPIGGFFVESSGAVIGTPWNSFDPLLAGVHVLDWVILALPVLAVEGEGEAWSGERALPTIGQYEFGVTLPLRYEHVSDDAPVAGKRIRASGVLERSDIEVAVGLDGDVRFDYVGEVEFDGSGRLAEARVELRVEFDASDGTEVSSRHHVRINADECPDRSINPGSGRADSPEG